MPNNKSEPQDTTDLNQFHLDNIRSEANNFNASLNRKHSAPFPRSREESLSWYNFKDNRNINILKNGLPEGGMGFFVAALFDFSFFRSMVAPNYSTSPFAQPPHDPAALLCLLVMAITAIYFGTTQKSDDIKKTAGSSFV